jgi:hypothetical protein
MNEAPLATIGGANTLLQPIGIALDSTGRIYVANGVAGSNEGFVTMYAPNPIGALDETPLARIQGSATQLAQSYGIAVDAAGRIYVTNLGQATGISTPEICVFAANPVGYTNEAPIGTISDTAQGIAVYASPSSLNR